MTRTFYRPPAGRASALARKTRTSVGVVAIAALGTLAAAGVGASPASAAQYRAFSCQTPSGQPAASTGWAPVRSANAVTAENVNECDRPGGSLTLGLLGAATYDAGTTVGWAWHPPVGVSVTRAAFARYGSVMTNPGDKSASPAISTNSATGNVESCVAWNGCNGFGEADRKINVYWNQPYFSGETAGKKNEIHFAVACAGSVSTGVCGPGGPFYRASYRLYRAEFELSDINDPTGSVTGDLETAPFLRSTVSAQMRLADGGAGVQSVAYQRLQDSAWKTEITQGISGNKASCTPVDTDTYTDVQPCARELNTGSEWNTDLLPEGTNTYRLVATDAAGNVGVVSPARSRTVDRTAPVSDFAALKDSCTPGERVDVTPRTTDALSGVESATTIVLDNQGKNVPVAADGTIACPDATDGPLMSQTTAVDKAGNRAALVRPNVLAIDGPVGAKDSIGVAAPKAPTIAPPVTQAPPAVDPPRADKNPTAAADALLACTRKGVVLTEAYPMGRRDVLRGVVGKQYQGQTVTIVYGPKSKVVARQPVQADGTFAAMVKAPKGRQARGNKARYVAIVGKEKSSAIKRDRRMWTEQVYLTKSSRDVYILGRLTKPFKKGTKVEVQTRPGGSCGAFKTVLTTQVNARGYFGATVPVTKGNATVVVRARGQVQKTVSSKRSSRTQTLPAAVAM
jgi:hypothetical protein